MSNEQCAIRRKPTGGHMRRVTSEGRRPHLRTKSLPAFLAAADSPAHKADAERLIAAARQHPQQVFAAMFQLRTEPRYTKLRRLIQSGELGELVRLNWIITDWYRTEAYYASGGWRATWKGEGGGVL